MQTDGPRPPVRVLVASSGLGIARRGFERAARSWFDALRTRDELEVNLVKAGGPASDPEYRAPTLSRDLLISQAVGRRLGRHSFWLEQVVFAATMQPFLLRLRPEVVMLNEWALARGLAIARRWTGRSFRLLLCNGAAGGPPYPDGVDHVQQPTPDIYERALAAGMRADAQTLLPYALEIPAEFDPPADSERNLLRRRLGLPLERRIVLSVGALNIWQKRMDYLIRELGLLGAERPFLVMLGAHEEETPTVLALAREHLGEEGFAAPDVPSEEVFDYYRAADIFALASGYEPFGLVFVEALAHGLPVIAQDAPVMRYVIGDHGYLGHFVRPGALAELVGGLSAGDAPAISGMERHRHVYERFSWDKLAGRYVEMLTTLARG